jgi:hypothetical protein
MDILKGDVIVLNMDDEFLLVDSVNPDDGTFLIHAPVMSIETGLPVDYWHEYEANDVMTVYREVK